VEAVFPGDRRVLVGEPLDPQDIAGEDGGYCGTPEGKSQSVSVAELTGMEQSSIGGPLRLIGIADMPDRPGQIAQRGGADVLPVTESEFAMLLGPIERGGPFEVGPGLPEIAGQ
jgi:hypothetical protein